MEIIDKKDFKIICPYCKKETNMQDLDDPIAEFTSEGVETNKITGTKGEISKVLIVDMGTQTWFSRM